MKCMDKHEFEQQNVFATGAANTAYAKFFIGQSFLNPLTAATTGTSTTPPRAAASCWFVPQAKAGTRKRANLPSA